MDIVATAQQIWQQRVEEYEAPKLDQSTENAVWRYVENNFGGIDQKYKKMPMNR